MKKKLGTSLALFSFIILIYSICHADKNGRLYDTSVSELQFEQIKADRVKSSENLINELYFNEERLFFDKTQNTFYYSMIEDSATADNPYIEKKTANASVALAFLNEKITAENIKKNHAFSIIAYDDDYYSEYKLKCTTVPIMNIDCDSEIERENVLMNLTLFDNRKNTYQRFITSEGNIHLRGASTSRHPKKPFRISLIQNSLGNNERNNKVSLLGMRQDDDWLLYPAYDDQEKIRNVFSSNLWKYSCANDNSLKIDNGMEYKYIELFINNEYWGLYALGYPIDELQLEIDFNKNERIYKKIYWDKEEMGYDIVFDKYNGYETTITGNNDWQPLINYYFNLSNNQNDLNYIYNSLDINNAIDMYMFINLIQGIDNVSNNFVSKDMSIINNMFISIKNINGKNVAIYAPWDLDRTWGNISFANTETSFTSPYYINSEYNITMENGGLQLLIESGNKEIWQYIFYKYKKLRQTLWSEDSINTMIDKYENDIFNSGAYLREMERWPNGSYVNVQNGLSKFRSYVMDRLQKTDEYYTRLEKVYDKGIYLIRSARYKNFNEANFIIEINNKELLYDNEYKELLEYIGVDLQKITDDIRFIFVNGKNQKFDYLKCIDKNIESIDTCIGKIKVSESNDENFELYFNDTKLYETSYNPSSDIKISFIIENSVEELSFKKGFNTNIKNNYVIEILNHNAINEKNFLQLLERIGINKEDVKENTDFIIVDGIKQVYTILNDSHTPNSINDTVIGTLSIFYNAENGYGVYLNNNECIIVDDSEINKNIDVRVATINEKIMK